ncbi:nose resistant to fluoxetine protein 6-like [Sitophilus oryzae]|uniref:Nose resistant to fluoxetine protein 6-like n=1 Tax=Sitophilus oryzae TaxID=7048 RepID=A0A6J2YHS5_SITOR|nr:nose resistant to fluoxetine protein 6-like [Sitophilus oryzae]
MRGCLRVSLLVFLTKSAILAVYANEQHGQDEVNEIFTAEDIDFSFTTEKPEETTTIKKKEPVKLNLKQGLAMNQILDTYSLTDASNELCRNHSIEFSMGMRRFESWALDMFDASSKLQSGLLLSNLFEFGNYKQCISIYTDDVENGPLRGKHCTLKVFPDTRLLKKILTFRNVSEKRWDKVKVFVEDASMAWSICVPDSCDVDDVLPHFRKLIRTLTEGLNLTVALRQINCLTAVDQAGASFSGTEVAVIGSFLIYTLLISVLTILDFRSADEKGEENKLFKIFSARRNTINIFAKSSKGPSDLDCVHGIRFLSTCYVIIGHRYLMMMFFPVINSLHIMEWILYYRSTAITGGTLCVDTFFVVSAILVSIGYSKQASKGPINWFMFYFYRYMRITPPLAIVVLWYSTLMQYFGSGPLWNDMLEVIQKPCQEYWLATIMHVQNYVHPYPLCLTQAWYLTCDMQYYYFSPIVLIPLTGDSVYGYINYIAVYLVSMGVTFYFAYINKYNGGVPVTNQLFSTKYFQHFYIAPHVRSSTYIIGLGFGHFLYKTRGRTFKISNGVAFIGWIICILTMLTSLMGCLIFFQEDHDYNRMESTIFLTLSRSSWTMGIVWMIWACVNGYGGPINYVLSLHIFKVLGRISYGMYLLHMGVQYMMSGAAKMPGYFSDFASIYAGFSDLFLMVIMGYIFTILFEAPLIQALNILIKSAENKSEVHPQVTQVVKKF